MAGEIIIPGQPNTDMTQTNEILYGILSVIEERHQNIEEIKEDVWHMSYPKDGTRATLTTGTTTLDFDAGTIMTPADAVSRMSSSLRKRGKAFMQSVMVDAERDVVIQFDNEDKIYLRAAHRYVASNKEFTKLRITTTESTSCTCLASSTSDIVSVIGAENLSWVDVEVRAASGALTAGESTTPITGLGIYNSAVLRLNVTTITTPDGDDEVDFYIQTSYDAGATWVDVEAIHYATADNGNTAALVAVISLPQSSAVARTATDGTLADDTKLDIPLGDRLRIKTKVTGATDPTYAYNCIAAFKV